MAPGIVRAADRVAFWHEADAESQHQKAIDDLMAQQKPPASSPPPGEDLGPMPDLGPTAAPEIVIPNSNKFTYPAKALGKLLDTHSSPEGTVGPPHGSKILSDFLSTPGGASFSKTYLKPQYQDAIKATVGEGNYAKLLHHMPKEHHEALTQHSQKAAPKSNKFTYPTKSLKKLLDNPNTTPEQVQYWKDQNPGYTKTYLHNPSYQQALKKDLGSQNYEDWQEHLGEKPAGEPAKPKSKVDQIADSVKQHMTGPGKPFKEMSEGEFFGPGGPADPSLGPAYPGQPKEFGQPAPHVEKSKAKSPLDQAKGMGIPPENTIGFTPGDDQSIADAFGQAGELINKFKAKPPKPAETPVGKPGLGDKLLAAHPNTKPLMVDLLNKKSPEEAQAFINTLSNKDALQKVYDEHYGRPEPKAGPHYDTFVQNAKDNPWVTTAEGVDIESPEFQKWFAQQDKLKQKAFAADPSSAMGYFQHDTGQQEQGQPAQPPPYNPAEAYEDPATGEWQHNESSLPPGFKAWAEEGGVPLSGYNPDEVQHALQTGWADENNKAQWAQAEAGTGKPPAFDPSIFEEEESDEDEIAAIKGQMPGEGFDSSLVDSIKQQGAAFGEDWLPLDDPKFQQWYTDKFGIHPYKDTKNTHQSYLRQVSNAWQDHLTGDDSTDQDEIAAIKGQMPGAAPADPEFYKPKTAAEWKQFAKTMFPTHSAVALKEIAESYQNLDPQQWASLVSGEHPAGQMPGFKQWKQLKDQTGEVPDEGQPSPEDQAFQAWFSQTVGMDEAQAKQEWAKMPPQGIANWSPGSANYEKYGPGAQQPAQPPAGGDEAAKHKLLADGIKSVFPNTSLDLDNLSVPELKQHLENFKEDLRGTKGLEKHIEQIEALYDQHFGAGAQAQPAQPDLQALEKDLHEAFGGTAAASWMAAPDKIPSYLNSVIQGGGENGAKAKKLLDQHFGQGAMAQPAPAQQPAPSGKPTLTSLLSDPAFQAWKATKHPDELGNMSADMMIQQFQQSQQQSAPSGFNPEAIAKDLADAGLSQMPPSLWAKGPEKVQTALKNYQGAVVSDKAKAKLQEILDKHFPQYAQPLSAEELLKGVSWPPSDDDLMNLDALMSSDKGGSKYITDVDDYKAWEKTLTGDQVKGFLNDPASAKQHFDDFLVKHYPDDLGEFEEEAEPEQMPLGDKIKQVIPDTSGAIVKMWNDGTFDADNLKKLIQNTPGFAAKELQAIYDEYFGGQPAPSVKADSLFPHLTTEGEYHPDYVNWLTKMNATPESLAQLGPTIQKQYSDAYKAEVQGQQPQQAQPFDAHALTMELGTALGISQPMELHQSGKKWKDKTPEEAKADLEELLPIYEEDPEGPKLQAIYDKYFGGTTTGPPTGGTGGGLDPDLIKQHFPTISDDTLANWMQNGDPAAQKAKMEKGIRGFTDQHSAVKAKWQAIYDQTFGGGTPAAGQGQPAKDIPTASWMNEHYPNGMGHNGDWTDDEIPSWAKSYSSSLAMSSWQNDDWGDKAKHGGGGTPAAGQGITEELLKKYFPNESPVFYQNWLKEGPQAKKDQLKAALSQFSGNSAAGAKWQKLYDEAFGSEEAAEAEEEPPQTVGQKLKALKGDIKQTAEELDAKLKGKSPEEAKKLFDTTAGLYPEIADALQKIYDEHFGSPAPPAGGGVTGLADALKAAFKAGGHTVDAGVYHGWQADENSDLEMDHEHLKDYLTEIMDSHPPGSPFHDHLQKVYDQYIIGGGAAAGATSDDDLHQQALNKATYSGQKKIMDTPAFKAYFMSLTPEVKAGNWHADEGAYQDFKYNHPDAYNLAFSQSKNGISVSSGGGHVPLNIENVKKSIPYGLFNVMNDNSSGLKPGVSAFLQSSGITQDKIDKGTVNATVWQGAYNAWAGLPDTQKQHYIDQEKGGGAAAPAGPPPPPPFEWDKFGPEFQTLFEKSDWAKVEHSPEEAEVKLKGMLDEFDKGAFAGSEKTQKAHALYDKYFGQGVPTAPAAAAAAQPMTISDWQKYVPSGSNFWFNNNMEGKSAEDQMTILKDKIAFGGDGTLAEGAKKALEGHFTNGTAAAAAPQATIPYSHVDFVPEYKAIWPNSKWSGLSAASGSEEKSKARLEEWLGSHTPGGATYTKVQALYDKYFGGGGGTPTTTTPLQGMSDEQIAAIDSASLVWTPTWKDLSPEEQSAKLKSVIEEHKANGLPSPGLQKIYDEAFGNQEEIAKIKAFQEHEEYPGVSAPAKSEQPDPRALAAWSATKPHSPGDWSDFASWLGKTALTPEQEQGLYSSWFPNKKLTTPEAVTQWFQQVYDHHSKPSTGDLTAQGMPAWASTSWALGNKAQKEWPAFQQWASKDAGIPAGMSTKQKLQIWNGLSAADKKEITENYLSTNPVDPQAVVAALQQAYPDSDWTKWNAAPQGTLKASLEMLAKGGYDDAIPIYNQFYNGKIPMPEPKIKGAEPAGPPPMKIIPPSQLPEWVKQKWGNGDEVDAERYTKLKHFTDSIGIDISDSYNYSANSKWAQVPLYMQQWISATPDLPWSDEAGFKEWKKQQPNVGSEVKALYPEGTPSGYYWNQIENQSVADGPFKSSYFGYAKNDLGKLIEDEQDPQKKQALLGLYHKYYGEQKTTLAQSLSAIYPNEDWDEKLKTNDTVAVMKELKKLLKTEKDPEKWIQLVDTWAKYFKHPDHNKVAPSGIAQIGNVLGSSHTPGDPVPISKLKMLKYWKQEQGGDPKASLPTYSDVNNWDAGPFLANKATTKEAGGYPGYHGWTPPGLAAGQGFVADPAMLLAKTPTYTAPAATGGGSQKEYDSLVETATKHKADTPGGGGLSKQELDTVKSQEFQNWFNGASRGYKNAYQHNPGIALEDFQNFMEGGSLYSPAPAGQETFTGGEKYIDPSPFANIPQRGDKDIAKRPMPRGLVQQPQRSKSIKFPRRDPTPGQETFPLMPGEHFAPDYAPLPIYRIVKFPLRQRITVPPKLRAKMSAQQQKVWVEQQQGRLRRIDELVNGTAINHDPQKDQQTFTSWAKSNGVPEPEIKQLANELYSEQLSVLEPDEKWKFLQQWGKDHGQNATEMSKLADGLSIMRPPEATGNYEHPELADLILDFIEAGGNEKADDTGLGIHWTRDIDKAYEGISAAGISSDDMKGRKDYFPVVLHGRWGGQGEANTTDMAFAANDPRELEHNLFEGAPVHIHRVQIRDTNQDWHDLMDYGPISLYPPGRDETANVSKKKKNEDIHDKPSLALELKDKVGGSFDKADWDKLVPGPTAERKFYELWQALPKTYTNKAGVLVRDPAKEAQLGKIYQKWFVGRPDLPTKPHERNASVIVPLESLEARIERLAMPTYYHRSVRPIGDPRIRERSYPHSYFYTPESGDPYDADWETRAYGDQVYSAELPEDVMEPDPAPRRNPAGAKWWRTDPSNVGEMTHIYDPDAPFGVPRKKKAGVADLEDRIEALEMSQ